MLAEIAFNFILPYLIYILTSKRIGDVDALLASSLPPIAWSVFEFICRRRVDAISLLVIAGIVLSLLAFLGGGSVRFLQLRENLITGVIGLVFLGSAAIGRPLIYQLARAGVARSSAANLETFEQQSRSDGFRASMTIMTVVWGVGLLVETAIACVLVYVMTIGTFIAVSPFLGYGTMGALGLWTYLYAKRAQRKGDERQGRQDQPRNQG